MYNNIVIYNQGAAGHMYSDLKVAPGGDYAIVCVHTDGVNTGHEVVISKQQALALANALLHWASEDGENKFPLWERPYDLPVHAESPWEYNK